MRGRDKCWKGGRNAEKGEEESYKMEGEYWISVHRQGRMIERDSEQMKEIKFIPVEHY